MILCVAAGGVYLTGAGRSYGYDESVTVGGFVATPSLLDPFRRQIVFNNHPLFSFLEHVIWSAGGRSETWMRLLPALFAAATVGIIGWWGARRWCAVAGLAAGGVLAVNPLFVDAARSVRGYSLVALCAVVSTIMTVQLVERGERRSWSVAYVVATAAGLAVHFYMAFVLAGIVVFVAARGKVTEGWRLRWFASALFGSLAYLGLFDAMFAASQLRGRSVRLSFPLEAARDLLGTRAMAVVSLALVVAAIALVSGRRREVVLPALAVGGLLTFVWLVLAPIDLYPRFLVWLVPGVAVCVGRAVARWRVALVPAAVAIVAMIGTWAGSLGGDKMALPKAAALVEATRAGGGTPCAIGAEALLAYTTPPRDVTDLTDIDSCDVVVVIASGVPAAAALERPGSGFPAVTTLPGTGVVVLSR